MSGPTSSARTYRGSSPDAPTRFGIAASGIDVAIPGGESPARRPAAVQRAGCLYRLGIAPSVAVATGSVRRLLNWLDEHGRP
jgi:hypothetical protein